MVKEHLEQDVGVSDPPKTEEKCQDHWTSKLKKDWHNVYSLLTQSGFFFYTVTHWVSATPDVWELLLKSNQCNACYWHKHCYPHYNDMLYINKGIIATEDGAYHPSLPPQPPATTESQPVSEDTA
uniref:Uncharacterized protein n=1 Tax=Moniliophthora roreri TaxID=221103 RepID=A0A0W0FX13_MONRR